MREDVIHSDQPRQVEDVKLAVIHAKAKMLSTNR